MRLNVCFQPTHFYLHGHEWLRYFSVSTCWPQGRKLERRIIHTEKFSSTCIISALRFEKILKLHVLSIGRGQCCKNCVNSLTNSLYWFMTLRLRDINLAENYFSTWINHYQSVHDKKNKFKLITWLRQCIHKFKKFNTEMKLIFCCPIWTYFCILCQKKYLFTISSIVSILTFIFWYHHQNASPDLMFFILSTFFSRILNSNNNKCPHHFSILSLSTPIINALHSLTRSENPFISRKDEFYLNIVIYGWPHLNYHHPLIRFTWAIQADLIFMRILIVATSDYCLSSGCDVDGYKMKWKMLGKSSGGEAFSGEKINSHIIHIFVHEKIKKFKVKSSDLIFISIIRR